MSRQLPNPHSSTGPDLSRATVGFGVFTCDPRTRQVVARGRDTVHLTPKAFDLLEILIAQAPRVVRKTELHERLWPETFVSDATLAGLVKELRRAFDAHLPGTPIIRTAHSVGFAFCAPLTAREPPEIVATRQWVIARNRRFSLKEGENIIGRDPASEVWLDGPSVSRRHARIVIEGAQARLEDLGSKNGTRLRNARLTAPARLGDGDELQIGKFSIVYREVSSDGSTESLHDRSGDGPPE
jgi:DNA-binding winged helix-turn-helix (wHTH) protein